MEELERNYESYKEKITGYMYWMGLRKEEVEDIVQETFLIMVENERYKKVDMTNTRYWLQTARNIALQNYRKRKAEKRFFSLRKNGLEGLAGDELDDSELKYQIRQTFERIDYDEMYVWKLRKIERIKVAEIARIMGKDELEIKKMLRNSRRKIKRKLQRAKRLIDN